MDSVSSQRALHTPLHTLGLQAEPESATHTFILCEGQWSSVFVGWGVWACLELCVWVCVGLCDELVCVCVCVCVYVRVSVCVPKSFSECFSPVHTSQPLSPSLYPSLSLSTPSLSLYLRSE